MKLFIDLDETLIKSLPYHLSKLYKIKQSPDFEISINGSRTLIYIRPSIRHLKDTAFSIFSAGGYEYVNTIANNLRKKYSFINNKLRSVYTRHDMSKEPSELSPNTEPVYNKPCLLIDERRADDPVVIQKLNSLPRGLHIKIKPFDRDGDKVIINKDDNSMNLQECLLLYKSI